ncbi:MAG: hypothetical protein ACKO3B_09775, partial [Bacteroidota bacterium]
VGFAAATSTLIEGATATVGYTTTLPAEVVPTISFGGTATQGTDYSITLTPAGIQISALEEWAADPNETITITLQSVSGNAQLGTTTVHTVTLTDPAAPAIGFTSASSAGNEGQTLNVPFNQSLPAGVTPSITVTGNAVPATDYSYSVTQTGLTIQLFSDALADGTETISFTITSFNTNGAEFGTILQHTVTVNDIAFVTGFAAATSTVTEGSSGTVTFESPIPAGVNPTFSFTGTATTGADYTYTVTASGITVTAIEEWRHDPNETVIITITGTQGNSSPGAITVHTLTINDAQGQTIEFVTASSTAAEGQVFQIPFTNPLPAGAVPTLAVAGTASPSVDYSYTITTTGISVDLTRDSGIDNGETIAFTITGFNNTNAVEFGTLLNHTLTITDAVNIVEFADSGPAVTEGQSKLVSFTFPLPAGVTPTVTYGGTATPNVDYTATVGTAGVTINATEEWLFDPAETVIITLTAVTGNAQVGTNSIYTLTLTDPPSQLVEFASPTSVVTEGQTITIPFKTPLPTGVLPTVSVSGTAVYEQDYFYNVSSTGVVILTASDGEFDVDETFTVTLTGFSSTACDLGIAITNTVTIQDTPMIIGFQTITSRRIEGTSIAATFSQPLPAGVNPVYTVTGTATNTLDYILTQGQNGFVVTTKKDAIYDREETVIIQITGFTGNVITTASNTHTLTIEDEDEKSVARLTIGLKWDSGDGTPGD